MPPLSVKKPDQNKSNLPSNPLLGQNQFIRVEALSSKSPGALLCAAGDILRRSETCRSSGQAAVVDQAIQAIRGLKRSDVEVALKQVEVESCKKAAVQAAAESFEAAFADSTEERDVFAQSAKAALLTRDSVESVLVAAREYTRSDSANDLVQLIDETERALGELDAELTGSMGRSLTGINPERRELLAGLDPSARAKAVWFASFVDADDMLPGLGGVKTDGLTADTQRSLRASSSSGFLSSGKKCDEAALFEAEASALGRVTHGVASNEERAFLEARAERRPALKDDLSSADAPLDTGE